MANGNSAASTVGALVPPIIGLGFGLAAINAVNRVMGQTTRGKGIYIVYARGQPYKRFRNPEPAVNLADELRSKGVLGVFVRFFQ